MYLVHNSHMPSISQSWGCHWPSAGCLGLSVILYMTSPASCCCSQSDVQVYLDLGHSSESQVVFQIYFVFADLLFTTQFCPLKPRNCSCTVSTVTDTLRLSTVACKAQAAPWTFQVEKLYVGSVAKPSMHVQAVYWLLRTLRRTLSPTILISLSSCRLNHFHESSHDSS